MLAVEVRDLEQWRAAARALLARGVSPGNVHFHDGASPSLLEPLDMGAPPALRVPRAFQELAEDASLHRDLMRWGLLYEVLYRIAHGERHLLEIEIDPAVRRLREMQKAVGRDVHKMHAFVRFRKLEGVEPEEFVAWYRPDHWIVPRVGPWFAARFGTMRWGILTPDASVFWNTKELRYGPGVPRSQAPDGDELEGLWKTYYGNIFNPARVKVKAMKAEMAVRHWATLPETALIPRLLAEAAERERLMIERTAAAMVEPLPGLPAPLEDAPLMLVTDLPVDLEVGEGAVVTCAVRTALGRVPKPIEVARERARLFAEIAAVRPLEIVAMGPAAALALLGRHADLPRERDCWFGLANGARVLVMPTRGGALDRVR